MLCNSTAGKVLPDIRRRSPPRHLWDRWGLARAVRVAGDALNLPFADNSLRLVCAFQMLSQFMNIEEVFLEVRRVLAPGGVFYFAEEPLKRLLTLGLYRAPYLDTMRRWERSLYEHGLLGYVVRDVIGAHQEESFGIRQNHSMYLRDWRRLIEKHFASVEYEVFVRSHRWGDLGCARSPKFDIWFRLGSRPPARRNPCPLPEGGKAGRNRARPGP
jgi:SAM-dependent methyltransferase